MKQMINRTETVGLALLAAFGLSIVMQIFQVIGGVYIGVRGLSLDFLESSKGFTVLMMSSEIILPIFLLSQYRNRKEERDLILPFPKNWIGSTYSISYGIGFLFFTAIWVLAAIFGGFTIQTIWSGKNALWLLLFFVAYCIQGMGEEILCRGYLQGRLMKNLSATTAIIISSLFFACLHLANDGITFLALLQLFLFGLIMGLIRYNTNNLWIVGAIHAAWNFAQGPIYGVAVSGTNSFGMILNSVPRSGKVLLNGGTFGIEGSLLSVIAHLILLVITYQIFKRYEFVQGGFQAKR